MMLPGSPRCPCAFPRAFSARRMDDTACSYAPRSSMRAFQLARGFKSICCVAYLVLSKSTFSLSSKHSIVLIENGSRTSTRTHLYSVTIHMAPRKRKPGTFPITDRIESTQSQQAADPEGRTVNLDRHDNCLPIMYGRLGREYCQLTVLSA